jgi:hypothetical protein
MPESLAEEQRHQLIEQLGSRAVACSIPVADTSGTVLQATLQYCSAVP